MALDIEKIIKEMTVEEKIQFVSGINGFETKPIPRLGVRGIIMSDGPHGLRKSKDSSETMDTTINSEISVCLPSGTSLASSWDNELIYKVSNAIAEECIHYGVDVILGPAINIQRNPLCGRHFEYVSEDPYISANYASIYVKGVQDLNVAACLKHFACNNNENTRLFGSSYVDERALHEIYLKPFIDTIKASNPYTMMCAYNKLNGTFCSENYELLTSILRKRAGFCGVIMSDWSATNLRYEGVKAGLDLEMPGSNKDNDEILRVALKEGKITEEDLNKRCKNILKLNNVIKEKERKKCDFEKHHLLAIEAAEKSAILLKNETNLLPINKDENYVILGEMFEKNRYQGLGSSFIFPYKREILKQCFDTEGINYKYFKGYELDSDKVDEKLENEALKEIKDTDKVFICVGLNDEFECEGLDRKTYKLPDNQISLVNKVLKVNKNVILLIFSGSPFELDAIEEIPSILLFNLGGEGVAKAATNIILGKVNPSGKLVTTWPKKEEDIPYIDEFKNDTNIRYKESIYVGYRYYDTFGVETNFNFGHGLSYSKFEYTNPSIIYKNGRIKCKLTVKNISNVDGYETIQVYYEKEESNVYRAKNSLIGFKKEFIKANSEKEFEIEIDKKELEIFDVNSKEMVIENGSYLIKICKRLGEIIAQNSIDVVEESQLNSDTKINQFTKDNILNISNAEFDELNGFKIEEKGKEITLFSPIKDYKNSHLIGRIFYKAAIKSQLKQIKKVQKIENKEIRDHLTKNVNFSLKSMLNFTLNAMNNFDCNQMPKHTAIGLVELANGHIFKGLKSILKKK